MSVNKFKELMGIETLNFRRPKGEADREKIYAIFTYEGDEILVSTTTKGTLRSDIVNGTIKHSELQIAKMPGGNYVMCYAGGEILASI